MTTRLPTREEIEECLRERDQKREVYVELLTFADFVPDEHPRDEHGKFTKGAVGDTVEYSLTGISGKEKHTGEIVHSDDNGVAVKDHKTGNIRVFEHKDVKVLPTQGDKLGATRIPTASELVDAHESEASKWMLSDVGYTHSQRANIETLEAAVAGVKAYKYEHSPEMDAHVAKVLADTQAELDAAKAMRIAVPSEVDQTHRELYKAAIAEHLGNALLDEMERNPKLKQELKHVADRPWGDKERDDALQRDLASGVASDFIHTWAETSGDTHPKALAIQKVAAEEFGIPMAAHMQRTMDENPFAIGTEIEDHHETIRTLVRAQYDWTQKELAAAGIKEMTLYRGAAIYRPTAATEDTKIHLQPLSSFSVEYETASGFAGHGADDPAVIATRVPATRIFSTAKTGFGCLNEGEVVVLGGQNLGAVIAWKKHSTDLDHLSEMKDRIGSGVKPAPPTVTEKRGS